MAYLLFWPKDYQYDQCSEHLVRILFSIQCLLRWSYSSPLYLQCQIIPVKYEKQYQLSVCFWLKHNTRYWIVQLDGFPLFCSISFWQARIFIPPFITHSSYIQTLVPSIMHSCISISSQLHSVSSLPCGQSTILSQYLYSGMHCPLSSVHLLTIDLIAESNGVFRHDALHISVDPSWQSILPSQILFLQTHRIPSAHFVVPVKQFRARNDSSSE